MPKYVVTEFDRYSVLNSTSKMVEASSVVEAFKACWPVDEEDDDGGILLNIVEVTEDENTPSCDGTFVAVEHAGYGGIDFEETSWYVQKVD